MVHTSKWNIFASKRNLSIISTNQLIALLHNASTLPTHYVAKNQNVPIVTYIGAKCVVPIQRKK